MPSSKVRHAPLDRSITHRLHTLSKLTDRVSQAAYESEIGLPMSEGRCLAAIGSFGSLSVNELGRCANLTKGQASRAAQSLVDLGLVTKEASETDGRGVVLATTPRGAKAWDRVMTLIERRNEEIAACLTARERQQLDTLLDRLVEHARGAAEGSD